MDIEELKPCPFCGSGVLHRNNPEKMGYTFFVSCGLCDCRGACLPTEQGAVDAWNTRAAAIPEGYVVVPVEDAEDARLGRFVKNFDVQTLELTLERMKYVFSHPEEFPVPPAKEQS